jgi:putative ABC transport system permease protein
MNAGRPLRTAPWVRAPTLLLRRPVVFVAVLAAVGVLCSAAASGVLFASTIGTASVQAQAASDCPEASLPHVAVNSFSPRLPMSNTTARRAMAGIDGSRGAYTVDTTQVSLQDTALTLFSRAGELRHVTLLTPDSGQPGAWVPRTLATQLRLRPGAVLITRDGGRIPIAGIYRDMAPNPFAITNLPRYWCTWSGLIKQRLDTEVPPFVLADPATLVSANHPSAQYGPQPIEIDAYAALDVHSMSIDSLTRADAQAPAALGKLGRSARGAFVPPSAPAAPPQADPLGAKIATAEQVQRGMSGSVLPVAVAGALVALLLVAGGGAFWAAARRREIRLLTSRGVAPRHLGAKAVLETGPPAILGAVAGVLAAWALVRMVGPAREFTDSALGLAVGVSALALAVGLGLIFAVGAFAARERDTRTRRRRWWHFVPWELAPLGAAVWLGTIVRTTPGVTVEHVVVVTKPVLLVFPILGAVGAVLFVGRLLGLTTPLLTRVAPRLGHAAYLALRRVGRARALAVGLLIGTALPIALLTYSGMVAYGTHEEIAVKYHTNLGAPHVLNLIGVHEKTLNLHGRGTQVASYPAANGFLAGGRSAAVLGIDPATFGDFAYASSAQRAEVIDLAAGARSALLINAPPGLSADTVRIGRTRVPIHVVGRDDVFPGLRNGAFPMIVLDRAALHGVDPMTDRANQVWTSDADVARVHAMVAEDGYTVLGELSPQLLITETGLLPVTWIFGYLRALAFLIGGVAAAGLVFALAARVRQRTVAYVFTRRMGMSQWTHIRSLLTELCLVVGTGWAAGAVAGAIGFGVIVPALDVYPQLPPGAVFSLPASIFLGTGITVAVTAIVAAVTAHQLAEHAEPAAVLRLE